MKYSYLYSFFFRCTGYLYKWREIEGENPPFLIIRIADIVNILKHPKDPSEFSPVLKWDEVTNYNIIGITYHHKDHFVSCIKANHTWVFYDGLNPDGVKEYESTDIEELKANYAIYIRVNKNKMNQESESSK